MQKDLRSEPQTDSSGDQRSLASSSPGPGHSRAKLWIAFGLFLFVLGIYGLSGPGRIDIVDGQMRYDVAFNWIVTGHPQVRDPWIGAYMGVPGRDGRHYATYGAPGSVFAIPLVKWGLSVGAPSIQPSQFLFSFTSSIFGAAIAPILFLFYLELGASRGRALAWVMVSSFATYIWPISNSTFDNAQHAFFCLASAYFAFLSARRKSAIYAVLGGLMAAVLFLYQEYFLMIAPVLALLTIQWKSSDSSFTSAQSGERKIVKLVSATQETVRALTALVRSAWDGPGEDRSSCIRYCLFLAAFSVGIVFSLAYNDLRFGSLFSNGKLAHAGPPIFGNPLTGFLTLLVSPGKSIFLYSPAIVLGILGFRQLLRRAPVLATTVAAASVVLVLFLSCILFVGGDWCWGPRYLSPLLPLWALAFPFSLDFKGKRPLVFAIILLGFLVQGLALSVENQRFFFQRSLPAFFWADDPWFYMKHSALIARVGEAASLREGVPSTARVFNSLPIPNWVTYSLLGPPPNVPLRLVPQWMRNFQIYFLPRPWPLWMSALPAELRPINVSAWVQRMFFIMVLGVTLIYVGFRLPRRN